MEITNVSMSMTEIAHCKYGLFSVLACGRYVWYTHELRYDLLTPERGCIEGGAYTVLNATLDNEEQVWMLSNVNDRAGIILTTEFHSDFPLGSIEVGLDLGCINNQWAVVERVIAEEQLSEVLDGMSSFRIYIERRSAPMKTNDQVILSP